MHNPDPAAELSWLHLHTRPLAHTESTSRTTGGLKIAHSGDPGRDCAFALDGERTLRVGGAPAYITDSSPHGGAGRPLVYKGACQAGEAITSSAAGGGGCAGPQTEREAQADISKASDVRL